MRITGQEARAALPSALTWGGDVPFLVLDRHGDAARLERIFRLFGIHRLNGKRLEVRPTAADLRENVLTAALARAYDAALSDFSLRV